MDAATFFFAYSVGKMGLPVKSEEDLTMSSPMNSMDWGSRFAMRILGTVAMQVSRLSKGSRTETFMLGFATNFMVISVMMPRVPSEPTIRFSRE